MSVNTHLEINHLEVQCGKRVAHIDNVDLRGGACLVLRGANGSGKTSVLRALVGLRRAENIAIRWNGEAMDVGDSDWNKLTTYIGHANALKPELTVAENLNFCTALKQNKPDLNKSIAAAQYFGLDRHTTHRCATLSAGQMRRLSLCRLLTEQTPVWLLDEPLTALDADAQSLVQKCISDHLSNDGIIITATHHAMDFGAHAHTLNIEECLQ